jgi:hypothetical protein
MAVTQSYLTKLRRAVRRNMDADIDAELTDIIEECRLDLLTSGVVTANSETDSLILGAVRCYVRAKFGLNSNDAERNMRDYEKLKDDLMKKRDYRGYKVTFTVTRSAVAAKDVTVYFYGQTAITNTAGIAVIYNVLAGNQLEYVIENKTAKIDVTANATVTVELVG